MEARYGGKSTCLHQPRELWGSWSMCAWADVSNYSNFCISLKEIIIYCSTSHAVQLTPLPPPTPHPPCSWMLGAVVKSCVGEWKSNSGRRIHIGEWESYSGACSLQPGMSQQTSELSTYNNKITAWSYIKWKWIVGLSLIFAVLTPEYSTWHELRLVLFVFPFEL